MKSKLYLMSIAAGLLLLGAGCSQLLQDESTKQDAANTQSEIKTPPISDYVVKDWRKISTRDFSISFPSEFLYVPPLAEAPYIHTFWTPDETIFFTVESITSSVWCAKESCLPKDLTRIGAKKLYDSWKVDHDAIVVTTNIDGREALILTKSYQGVSRTIVAFLSGDLLYAITQSDTGKYSSEGQPLILKVVKTVQFNK